MMNRIILKNISKKFKIGHNKNKEFLGSLLSFASNRKSRREIVVLNNISLDLGYGEILGIMGNNGSGKSTLLRIIAGIFSMDAGSIEINGRIVSLINLRVGLKDRLTMKDNIFLMGSLIGMSYKEIEDSFNSIVEFCELEEFVNAKIYQFSAGMGQRLVFSIAIHSKPDILLLDEVFEIGDENFRKKSANKIKQMVSENNISVLLVSHDLDIIEKYCDRVIWIDKGQIFKQGNLDEIIKLYKQKF